MWMWLLACADGEGPNPRQFPNWRPRDTAAPSLTVERVSRGTVIPKLDLMGLPTDDGFVIDSGFGPRRMSLEDGRPDFHTGLDYDIAKGTPVYALGDGLVHRINPSEGEDDANNLYIEHMLPEPLAFHGESIDRFYAMYSHVDEFLVSAEGEAVTAGQTIATVGDSGNAVEPHLHLEIRLGTWCTLRYSVANPDSTCARDYDPAVNPLHVVPGRSPEVFDIEVLSTDPLIVQVATKTTDQDINRVLAETGALDLDLRTGLDATTPAGLDENDLGWLLLTTELEHVDPTHTRWTLEFRGDPGWVEILDIGGEGWRIERP